MRSIFVVTALLIITVDVFAKDPLTTGSYNAIFDQLVELRGDGRAAPISSCTIRRDAGAIAIYSGTVYPCRSLGGATHAVAIVGKGHFSFAPPSEMERHQLSRFFDQDTLHISFKQLFLLSADRTFGEAFASLPFAVSDNAGDADGVIKKVVGAITFSKGRCIMPEIAKALLDHDSSSFFYAYIVPEDGEPIAFEINPWQPFGEQVHLMRIKHDVLWRDYHELISQFPLSVNTPGKTPPAALTQLLVAIPEYRIQCSIKNNLEMSFACQMPVTAQTSGQYWFWLRLHPEMALDSAKWDGIVTNEAYKEKDNPYLWGRFPRPMIKGETCTLSIFYHGKISEKTYNWIWIDAASAWYPLISGMERASFDIRYEYPEKFKLVSVGSRISDSVADGRCISHFRTNKPIRNFSFNMGYFDTYQVSDKRIPPVTVLYTESNGQIYKRVAADVANSVNFFRITYGTPGFDSLFAAEYPGWTGIAFPGLVNLAVPSWLHFDDEGFTVQHSAHEVSHQWWGIGVDYASYHDQWLSEGLADFSGLWYLQYENKNKKLYFEWLDRYRDEIMDVRKYLLSSGKRMGSLWLGYRNVTEATPEDYRVLYAKGAWVFHMLRNLMLELNTMNEDAFLTMMRDYYATYRDSNVTTARFQAHVEKYTKTGMNWFFRQWIYGTAVPEYIVSHKTEQTAEGKFRVTCRFRQDNVPDDFQVSMPVEVDFGNNRQARFRIWVKASQPVFELPPLPLEPKKITFNIFNSVLCRLKQEQWKK